MTKLLWPELEATEVQEGWIVEVPQARTADVLGALRRRHPMDGFNGMPGRWVFAHEVLETTGAYGDAQRFDAVAIGLVPSVRYARVIYEIKVSRADWLRELRPIPDVRWTNSAAGVMDERREPARVARHVAKSIERELAQPDAPRRFINYTLVGEYHKWDAAIAVSTEYWIAAPPRVVQLDELPPEAGMLEVRPWGKDGEWRAKAVRHAPVRDTPNPDQAFWASVMRCALRKPEEPAA